MGDIEKNGVTDETATDVDEDTEDLEDDVTKDDTTSEEDDPESEGKLEGAKAKEFVSTLLDEYGLESPEDLADFMANLAGLEGKIAGKDLDQIIKNSETLENYQSHWEQQEREKLKDGETPEETIARLEKENQDLAHAREKDADKRKAVKAAEVAYESFCDTVETTVRSEKAIPREYYPFITEFLGVENPINDVNIEDKTAVRKIAKQGIKKLQEFEQAVIKRYRAGKTKIPKVSSSTETQTETTIEKKKEPKNLSDARRIMHQSMSALFGKK